MKRILVLLVGGTVCCAPNVKGDLAVSDRAGALLKVGFLQSDSPFAREVQIDETENLHILSETMTVDKWNRLRRTLETHLQQAAYDGVVIAHGTDTLGFSAALFAQLYAATPIPLIFVAAHRPLMDDASNGHANFRAAVECICRDIPPNVYVTYQNPSDGRMYLHLASRLRQCEGYSDDFHSVGACDITDGYVPPLTAPRGTHRFTRDLRDCVLMIEPYVGVNYAAYDYGRFAAVLHGAYHAGTAMAQEGDYGAESILYMMDRCAACGVDTYLAPAQKRHGTYETVSVIAAHGHMRFLHGFTRETTYAKLLIAYSFFEDDAARMDYLLTEQNLERILEEGDPV